MADRPLSAAVWIGRLPAGPVIAAATVLALATAAPAAAQAPLTLEIRGGAAIPVGVFTEGPESGGRIAPSRAFGVRFDLEQGLGFSVLLGFSQYRVDCRDDGCGSDEEWVSTQWQVGTRWRRSGGDLRPWFSVAAIFPKVERAVPTGEIRSPTTFGVEAGTGLLWRLTERWWLSPGLRWAASNPDFPGGPPVPMRLAVADLGLLIAF